MKFIEKKWFAKLLKLLYKAKWFKKRTDDYLRNLVENPFKFKRVFKHRQSLGMISIGPRGGYWEFVIKPKHKKTKIKKNRYDSEILFVAEKYHVLRLKRA